MQGNQGVRQPRGLISHLLYGNNPEEGQPVDQPQQSDETENRNCDLHKRLVLLSHRGFDALDIMLGFWERRDAAVLADVARSGVVTRQRQI